MIALTDDQISSIAQDLEMGMRCFYHLKTGEIITTPNFLDPDWYGQDTEPWQELLDKLDENWGEYFEFERMTSQESYKIMDRFSDTVDDLKLQDRLYTALNKPKPFRNFKWEIDNSGEYRQKWFDFKSKRFIEFVKTQIELHNRTEVDKG